MNTLDTPSAAQARTPTDFALEFAEYMATGAEQLLASLDALSAAELVREETGEDDGDVHDARDDVWGNVSSLRSAIYEFRKRRDRIDSTEQRASGDATRQIFPPDFGPCPLAASFSVDAAWAHGCLTGYRTKLSEQDAERLSAPVLGEAK